MYYIYILKCRDGKLYTGCTQDLEERIQRHKNGHVPATAYKLPISLEFYVAIPDKYKAFEFEKYLKSGSGRAFMKKHVIHGNSKFH
jgi:predicted GIY-YIG superfamily endonuclease